MTIDPIHYARRWKTLGVLSLSLVIIGLDNTILNVALPTLQHEFDASPSKLQWMVDSYLLVFAGLLLVFGTLGDRFGRKRALQVGVSIFGLASLGALIADSANQVIAVRAAMGVGAALIMPATLSIIANLFTGDGASQGDRHLGGAGSGRDRARPAHGRAAARVVRLVVRVHGQRAVRGRRATARHPLRAREPRSPARLVRPASGPRSPPPASASSCTRSSRPPDRAGPPVSSSDCSRCPSRCSAPSCGGSVAIDEPMLDLGFFRRASFSVGTAAVSVAFFALLGAIFALTQYLQFVHGYSAIKAGAIMSPIALGLMIGAGSSSKAAERLGVSRVVAAGLDRASRPCWH